MVKQIENGVRPEYEEAWAGFRSERAFHRGRGNSAAPLALLHVVVEPFAPVAGLALGVSDGIDDDVIVEFLEDDVEGEDAHVAMADLPLDGK